MNSKRMLVLILSTCLVLTLQGEALAKGSKGFSYTYVDAGYRGIRADSFDADGVAINLSYGATDHIMILADYSRLFQDTATGLNKVDVDINEFKIGGGGHFSFGDRFDLVGSVVYVSSNSTGEARVPGETTDRRINGTNEGYEAVVSGRIRALKKLELTPMVLYKDVGDFSDVGGGLDAIYNFHKKWSVRGNYTYFSEDSTSDFFLGVRLDL